MHNDSIENRRSVDRLNGLDDGKEITLINEIEFKEHAMRSLRYQ